MAVVDQFSNREPVEDTVNDQMPSASFRGARISASMAAVHLVPVELANGEVPRVRRAVRDATDAGSTILCSHLGFSSLDLIGVTGVTGVRAITGLFELDELGTHLGAGQASGLGGRCGRRLRRVIAGGKGRRGNHGGKCEGGNVFEIHEICSDS
jgi:hypothetical protein